MSRAPAHADRVRTLSAYLDDRGKDAPLSAEAFLPWLKERPDDPCWAHFFGQSDSAMAEARRKTMFARFMSSIRLEDLEPMTFARVVKDPVMIDIGSCVVPLESVTPAFARKRGVYAFLDLDDKAQTDDQRALAAQALRSWLGRYAGPAVAAWKVDLAPLIDLAKALEDG